MENSHQHIQSSLALCRPLPLKHFLCIQPVLVRLCIIKRDLGGFGETVMSVPACYFIIISIFYCSNFCWTEEENSSCSRAPDQCEMLGGGHRTHSHSPSVFSQLSLNSVHNLMIIIMNFYHFYCCWSHSIGVCASFSHVASRSPCDHHGPVSTFNSIWQKY